MYVHSETEIKELRIAGSYLSSMLNELVLLVAPGVNVLDIERRAVDLLNEVNVKSAFYGYMNYPSVICVSLNNEVVHGIPRDRVIKDGDVVKLDFGLVHQGFFVDAARTIGVGHLSDDVTRLINSTRKALQLGINQARVGNHIGDIGAEVQAYLEGQKLGVVRDLVGHGVGRALHEEPQVPNYGMHHTGPRIKNGLVIAIEPMVSMGDYEVEWLRDGWTVVTKDKSIAAHEEDTIIVTEDGPEVITRVV